MGSVLSAIKDAIVELTGQVISEVIRILAGILGDVIKIFVDVLFGGMSSGNLFDFNFDLSPCDDTECRYDRFTILFVRIANILSVLIYLVRVPFKFLGAHRFYDGVIYTARLPILGLAIVPAVIYLIAHGYIMFALSQKIVT